MKRLLTDDLRKWKDKPDRKPLILRGARQVTNMMNTSSLPLFLRCLAVVIPDCAGISMSRNMMLNGLLW